MEPTTTVTKPTKSPIPGFKMLLMGAPGAGKTHSIQTLLGTGVQPFVIFTESHSRVVLGPYLSKLHYRFISPAQTSFADMMSQTKVVMTSNPDALAKMREVRTKFMGFFDVLSQCNSFRDERTGEDFGDVSTWNTDRCLVIDSLSGLNKMVFQAVSGTRVSRTLPEYGQAQSLLQNFIEQLNTVQCHVVVTCHMEYDRDELTGANRWLPVTVGRKLAPVLPNTFSDFVLARYTGNEFVWATAHQNADLKACTLAVGQEKLQPNFAKMVAAWQQRGGVICPSH